MNECKIVRKNCRHTSAHLFVQWTSVRFLVAMETWRLVTVATESLTFPFTAFQPYPSLPPGTRARSSYLLLAAFLVFLTLILVSFFPTFTPVRSTQNQGEINALCYCLQLKDDHLLLLAQILTRESLF